MGAERKEFEVAVIAIDTNILVRVLTRDDARQSEAALRFLSQHECRVQTTVVLELEWVLRSVHRYSQSQIADAFGMLLETERLSIEEPERLERAIEGLRNGIEFTDAFHHAGAVGCEAFATFDRPLMNRAPRTFHQPPLIHP
jgi:predicted nucleic-acid-binding protein